MQCIYFRNRKENYKNVFWCLKDKHNKVKIELSTCYGCKNRKDKECTRLKQNIPLKKVTKAHAKAERTRFSILTDSMNRCVECEKVFSRDQLNYHEIFYGSGKRQLSIKYGLVIPLYWPLYHNQYECKGIHFDKQLCLKWQIKGQLEAMKHYGWSEDDFREIFGKSYLQAQKKS